MVNNDCRGDWQLFLTISKVCYFFFKRSMLNQWYLNSSIQNSISVNNTNRSNISRDYSPLQSIVRNFTGRPGFQLSFIFSHENKIRFICFLTCVLSWWFDFDAIVDKLYSTLCKFHTVFSLVSVLDGWNFERCCSADVCIKPHGTNNLHKTEDILHHRTYSFAIYFISLLNAVEFRRIILYIKCFFSF